MSDRPSMISKLKGTVSDGSSKRLLAFAVVVVVLVAGLAFATFRGGSQLPPSSTVAAVPHMTNAAGGSLDDPYSTKLTTQEDHRLADEAEVTGKSATPSISSATKIKPVDLPTPPVADMRAPPASDRPAAQVGGNSQRNGRGLDDNAMAAMQAQMRSLIQTWTPPKQQLLVFLETKPGELPVSATAATAKASEPAKKILIAAGKIAYAETLVRSSTDVPGPMVVTILDGPAKGGRAIGQFERADDRMVVHFTSLSLPDGRTAAIDAYGVDPTTAETSLGDDVDHHYVERFVLPIAAAFVEGYGQAVARAGQVVVTSPFGGATTTMGQISARQQLFGAVGTAGQVAADLIRQNAPKGPTVVENQHSGVGLLFVKSVEEPAS
jgi:intracellular multiplication protein IcmE